MRLTAGQQFRMERSRPPRTVPDPLFSATKCDRCGGPLTPARTMSWFTRETICSGVCALAELEIKKKLREKGIPGAMEGCGYVPTVD